VAVKSRACIHPLKSSAAPNRIPDKNLPSLLVQSCSPPAPTTPPSHPTRHAAAFVVCARRFRTDHHCPPPTCDEGRERLVNPSMAGDRSPTAERRRGIRRYLLARGEAGGSSSSPPPPAEEGRRKWFASAALRGLGCTSAAQAYAPGTAAVRSSADWHGRRGEGNERRKERGGSGLVSGGIGADVWCAPGIPFAAEASSVDCVVARHQMAARGRGGEGERSHPHGEVRSVAWFPPILAASTPLICWCFKSRSLEEDCSVLACRGAVGLIFLFSLSLLLSLVYFNAGKQPVVFFYEYYFSHYCARLM
jgi:hypothetical protein